MSTTTPVETPVKAAVTHAQKAAAAAIANVRTDLGDEMADTFKRTRALYLKNEENVDELMPVSKMLIDMLGKVPAEKTRSAGYAELLFAYGQVTFAFAKKSIYETTILGGDVEAAALKSTLEDALRSKSAKKTDKADLKMKADDDTKPEAGSADVQEGDTNGVEPKSPAQTPVVGKEPVSGSGKESEKEVQKHDAKEESGNEPEKDSKDDGKTEEAAKPETVVIRDPKSAAPTLNEPKSATPKPKANGDSGATEAVPVQVAEDEITAVAVDNEDEDEVDKDDVDNETLTWEQYEYARMIFEELGDAQRNRLPHVYEALGDLLLETDQHENATTEYGKALKLLEESPEAERDLRSISTISYQRYLALRGSKPADALAALDKSVDSFAKYAEKNDDNDSRDTLKAMQEDRAAFKEALPKDALQQAAAASATASDAPVQIVQPRRKKPAPAEPEPEPTVVQPRRKVRKVAEISDEDDEDTPPMKKPRVESEAEPKAADTDAK